MRKFDNPRAAAIKSLTRWQRDAKYINLELDASLDRASLTANDRALYAALTYGVCERAITLDMQIARLTGRPTSSIDAETLAALRVGLYQIYFMDRIPPHAAVNETVSVSPARSRGLVNAALRRALREGSELVLPENDGGVEYLSALHSIPRWMVESWMRDYPDNAAALCAAANRKPPVTLRVNTLRIKADELLARLTDTGISASPNALCPDMIDIESAGVAISELYGYREGYFIVQDAASRMCVKVLDPKPHERVADVCAAPGGKSLSCSIDMGDLGEVHAFDLHDNKLGLLRESAQRLGISSITTAARDARVPDPALAGRIDRVLCDVPCSGLGVIAKKPDIRYKNESDTAKLPEVQTAILLASADYVKRGGVLVYSTCTLRRAENDDVVAEFLRRREDFVPEPFAVGEISATDGTLTLMPHMHGTDGFYIAKLRRK